MLADIGESSLRESQNSGTVELEFDFYFQWCRLGDIHCEFELDPATGKLPFC